LIVTRPALYLWSGLGGRLGYVTGVGKHAKNMARELSRDLAWSYKLVLARGQQAAADEGDVVSLPFSRRSLDLAWALAGRPHADRWFPDEGWVYCPNEKYVPLRDRRYAVTVHDIYGYENEPSRIDPVHAVRRRRLLTTLDSADIIFTVSQFTRRRLCARFEVDSKKVVVIGNGVEAGFFSISEEDAERCRWEQVGAPYVLFVGGLRRKKGGADILRFAAALREAGSSLRVVVVGPVEPELASPTTDAENVQVLPRGFSDDRMMRLVRGAEVAMSFSLYEGFGIPLLEGMAAGVPVVAANRSAFREVAGDAAVLLDPADAQRAVHVTQDLIQDSARRRDLIERGRIRAAQFTWSASARRVSQAMKAYDEGRDITDLQEAGSLHEAGCSRPRCFAKE
jgi:alpha-1,3-rhamnosyl/mannosyltransferase